MASIQRQRLLTVANSPLFFFSQTLGVSSDPTVLGFEIFDVSTETNELSPVKVFPVSGVQSVNLLSDKVRTGQYVAVGWTPPASGNGSLGAMQIKWTYTLGGSVRTTTRDFEVLASVPEHLPGPMYITVASLRAEGLTAPMASDARAIKAIILASRMVEFATGRFFEPRYMELFLDGIGSPILMLDQPIIGITNIQFSLTGNDTDLDIDPDLWRVYGRHLSGQFAPDDRDSPKIELFSGYDDWDYGSAYGRRYAFPASQQNVKLTGYMGYTEYDGSPWGVTPPLIQRAVQLLVFRDIAKLAASGGSGSTSAARILEERTRDQSVKYSADPRASSATISGDPELDTILRNYKRPSAMGAA